MPVAALVRVRRSERSAAFRRTQPQPAICGQKNGARLAFTPGPEPHRQSNTNRLVSQHPRAFARGGGLKLARFAEVHFAIGFLLPGFRWRATTTTAAATMARHGVGLMLAFLIPREGLTPVTRHQAEIRRKNDPNRGLTAFRARCWKIAFGQATAERELAAARTFVFVEWHGSYFTLARSLPLTIFFGPLALGMMSNLKISVGRYNVAHAFGMSTMPLM